MASTRIVLICVCVVFVLLIGTTNCRGARGGGRFGGSRISSRVSSVRSIRVTRIGTPRYAYSSYRLSGTNAKQVAILAGTVYGARMWMRRSSYTSNRNYYPEVCYNDMYVGNETEKYYGRFVCPAYDDPDSFKYCCGSEGEQECCDNAFDSSSAQGTGRIAGIVIGVLVVVIIIAVVAYCCFKKRKTFQGKTLSMFSKRNDKPVHYHTAAKDESAKPLHMDYTATPPPPTTVAYGVQPMSDNAPLHPPSYGDAMSQPYPMSAPYDSGYKPPMPPGDVNTGGLPYGLHPEGYTYGQPVPLNNPTYASAPSDAAPYPPPSGNAPYPPASAPYPGGFVPPPGGAPYPQ